MTHFWVQLCPAYSHASTAGAPPRARMVQPTHTPAAWGGRPPRAKRRPQPPEAGAQTSAYAGPFRQHPPLVRGGPGRVLGPPLLCVWLEGHTSLGVLATCSEPLGECAVSVQPPSPGHRPRCHLAPCEPGPCRERRLVGSWGDRDAQWGYGGQGAGGQVGGGH